MSVFSDYKKELMDAAHNKRIRLALSRGIASYRDNTDTALKRFPHTIKLAEEVRAIKENAIDNMEKLAQQACEAFEYNKAKAYIAKTKEDALKLIGNLVGTDKLIVKGKSLTGEEIHLREYLEERGNDVYETDLGEFILQKLPSRPMHLVSPAIHVPREDVAQLFQRITGEEFPPDDIERMVAAARKLLREKYFQAHIGMSGSNVVAADAGTMFLISNEGNIRLSTAAPPVHIALVGMEKLVPTLGDAYKVAEVTWRYASYTVPGYVSLISSPSKTGDIEKVTTFGAHGPREVHVIFIDDGRTELAK
ncbi:MAG: lactate utilization protein, partial [Chloroflexi bacterium]|nr:lactate utilization protein [Chloroflexota bacterium]